MPWLTMLVCKVLRAPDDGAGAGAGPGAATAGSLLDGGGAAAAQSGAKAGGDAAPAAAGGAATGGGAADWLAGVDEAGRALVGTKGWKTGADVVKSYAELEKIVGADKLPLPGKDAKPEDWNAVWSKLGRPESPDKYQLPKPANGDYSDADKAFQAQILPELHKAGVTQRQLEAIIPAWNNLAAAQTQRFDQAATEQPAKTETALRQEWRTDDEYKTNLALANAAVKATFGGEGLQEFLTLRLADGTFLADHPLMARQFAALGKQMQADGLLVMPEHGGDGAGGDAKSELARIYEDAAKDPKHAFHTPNSPEGQKLMDKIMSLSKRIAESQAQ